MHSQKENIKNIPNLLTLIRVIVTFFLAYYIIVAYDLTIVVVLFIIGMLTDFFDGHIARKYNMVTEFGRKFDMLADRMLMLGTVIALVIHFWITNTLEPYFGLQIAMIMSREVVGIILASPTIIAHRGIRYPDAKFIGKLTTFCQGIAFPLILINMHYPQYDFSIYTSIFTMIIGTISGVVFVHDLQAMEK